MLIRLSKFFDKHNVFNIHQHGFRNSYSTSSAVADELDCVTAALDKTHVALALFIDVSKAFDSLNHNKLCAKLEHNGVRDVAFSWFVSYLSKCSQYIKLNGDCSLCILLYVVSLKGLCLGLIST